MNHRLLTPTMSMTMYRNIILVTAWAALIGQSIAAFSNGRGGQVDNSAVIRAEVVGTLHFQEGRGYFISVKSTRNVEWENRVWLWISEDKVLISQLSGLLEKRVIAKGELEQMPENVQARVPPLGMYLKRVMIEVAPEKGSS